MPKLTSKCWKNRDKTYILPVKLYDVLIQNLRKEIVILKNYNKLLILLDNS